MSLGFKLTRKCRLHFKGTNYNLHENTYILHEQNYEIKNLYLYVRYTVCETLVELFEMLS